MARTPWESYIPAGRQPIINETGDILTLQQRVARARDLGDNAALAQHLVRCGLALAMDGDPTEARAAAKEGLLLHRETGNVHGQAEAMTVLGRVYLSVELFDQAGQIFERVLDMFRAVEDRRNTVLTLLRLAQVRRDLGDPISARARYGEALDAVQRLGDRTLRARVLSSAAALYRELGERDRAMTMLRESAGIQRQHDPEGEPETLARLADLLLDGGEFTDALDILQDAWAKQRSAGSEVGAARTLARIAQIRFMTGENALARELYEDAGREQERLRDRRGLSRTRVGLAQVYVSEGNHTLAVALLEIELQEQQTRGLKAAECAVLVHLAATHLHAGTADLGRGFLNRAHDLAMRLGSFSLMAACRSVGSDPGAIYEPVLLLDTGSTRPMEPAKG